MVAAPDFGLCMRGAQEADCEAQEEGSPNSRHERLHTLSSDALRGLLRGLGSGSPLHAKMNARGGGRDGGVDDPG